MSYLNSKFQSGFSPQNIPGLVVWLDATDSNSITQSGGAVSLWKDRSPNALDVSQNTAGAQPTYESNVQNGLPAIRFTTSQMLRSTQNFTLGGAQTWFVSFKALATGNIFFVEQGPNTNSSDGSFLYGGNNSLMYMKRGGATRFIDDPIGRGTSPFSSNVWYIGGLSTSNINTASTDTYWSINGVYKQPLLSGTIGTSTATNQLYINNTARVPASNYMGEIIIYNQALSSNQMRLVERYLAAKWGVTLSNTHPYFSVPAALRPFNPLDISGCSLWLDAADARTIALFSGTDVSSWSDKSGGGYTAINGIYNRPTYTCNVAKPYVLFGSNQSMRVANWAYTTGWSVFTAQSNVAIGGGRWFISPYDTRGIVMMGFSNLKIFDVMSAQTEATGDHIEYTTAVNTNGAADYFYFRDGAQIASNNATRAHTAGALSLGIGANGNGTDPLVASGNVINLYELIIYNRSVSTLERTQIELYLAEKWGLRGNLSSSNALRLYESLSPVFNPTLISNCSIWLDAADYSSFDVSTNGTVTTWRDKSGNGKNATSQTAAGAVSSNFGGRSSLYFGRAPWYRTGAFTLSNSQGTAWFVVYATTGNITTSGAVFATSGTPERSIRQDSVVQFSGYSIHTGVARAYNDAGASNTPALYNFVDTPASFTVFKNGTQAYNTNTAVTYQSNSSQTGQIGYWNDYLLGHVFEICIYDSALTTAERQLVEGYLAQKWNISLPSNHPYKTIPV